MAPNQPTIKQEVVEQFQSSTTVRENDPVWVTIGKSEHMAIVLSIQDEDVEVKWSTCGKKEWVLLSQCRAFIDLSTDENKESRPRRSSRARTKTNLFVNEKQSKPKKRRPSARKLPLSRKPALSMATHANGRRKADYIAHMVAEADAKARAVKREEDAAKRRKAKRAKKEILQKDVEDEESQEAQGEEEIREDEESEQDETMARLPNEARAVNNSSETLTQEAQCKKEVKEDEEIEQNEMIARVLSKGDDVWVKDGMANNLHAAKVLEVEDDEVLIQWSTYLKKEWVSRGRVLLQEAYVDLTSAEQDETGATRRSRRSRAKPAFYRPPTEEPKKRAKTSRKRNGPNNATLAPHQVTQGETKKRIKRVARKQTDASRADDWEGRRQSFYSTKSTGEKRVARKSVFDKRHTKKSTLYEKRVARKSTFQRQFAKKSTFEQRFDFSGVGPQMLTGTQNESSSSSESATSETPDTVAFPPARSRTRGSEEMESFAFSPSSPSDQSEASTIPPAIRHSDHSDSDERRESSESNGTANALDVSRILCDLPEEDNSHSSKRARRETADSHELAGIFQDDDSEASA